MVTKKEEEKIAEMEEQLSQLEPNMDDWVDRRIHHINFAKIVYWMCLQTRKGDFIYPKELYKFLKTSGSHTYNLLMSMVNIGLLHKKYTGNLVEYHFVKNGGNPLIENYLDKAKRTLGLV